MEIIFLLIWAGFVVGCAMILNNKGRSWLAGAALGFFLGIIGLAICIWGFKADPFEQARREVNEDAERKRVEDYKRELRENRKKAGWD